MKAIRAGSLFLCALLFSTAAFAQDAPAFGAFVGFNQAWYSTQPENATEKKPALVVGGFAVLRRDKALKIQPEVQFSQRRVGATYTGQDYLHANSYVNLSLLVRTNLFKGIYSVQGPQFSIPVKGTLTVRNVDLDVKDNINPDVSLLVGFGRQFGRIGAEWRYDAGLRRVEDVPLGNFVKRNRAFTFMGIVAF